MDDPEHKNDCLRDVALDTGDVSVCRNIWGEKSLLKCVSDLASREKNPSLCDEFQVKEQSNTCYRTVAQKTDNPEVCALVRESDERDLCYSDLAVKRMDRSLCENIDVRNREIVGCYEAVKSRERMRAILFLLVFMYCYFGLVLMTLSRKMNIGTPFLAWIPGLNLYLLYELSKVHIIIFLLAVISAFIPGIGIFIAMLIGAYIWSRVAVNRNYPWWFGALVIIPFVNLLVIGALAWIDSHDSGSRLNK